MVSNVCKSQESLEGLCQRRIWFWFGSANCTSKKLRKGRKNYEVGKKKWPKLAFGEVDSKIFESCK